MSAGSISHASAAMISLSAQPLFRRQCMAAALSQSAPLPFLLRGRPFSFSTLQGQPSTPPTRMLAREHTSRGSHALHLAVTARPLSSLAATHLSLSLGGGGSVSPLSSSSAAAAPAASMSAHAGTVVMPSTATSSLGQSAPSSSSAAAAVSTASPASSPSSPAGPSAALPPSPASPSAAAAAAPPSSSAAPQRASASTMFGNIPPPTVSFGAHSSSSPAPPAPPTAPGFAVPLAGYEFAAPRQDVPVTRALLPQESALFHFDTHKLVKNLIAKGFTEQQAEVIMVSLSEVTASSISFILKNAMLKSEQEHFLLKYQSDLLTIRKEMQILEKSEFAVLRNESEKAKANMDKITEQLREEIDKLKAGVRLDFSLEKSRIREDTTLQEHKIKDTNNRIDTEIAGLRTHIESMKLDIVKFIAGTVISGFTLILGYIRFFKS